MIKYYVRCEQTCPHCLGRKENLSHEQKKWVKCKRCGGTGIYIHDVNLKDVLNDLVHSHYPYDT